MNAVTLDQLQEYLPFLIPIILVEMALMITALVHVLRHKNYRFGNRILWVVLVVCLQIVGPIVYFTIGRGEE
ncbi:MAG: hypothetical protein H6Q59_505 [Firmicutes bacterium]|nr:hypothetical protein [Bacillota bacterium]